jgi:hypothetical protein
LDERDKPKPTEPKCCSFCDEPATDRRILVDSGSYPLICATCAKQAVAMKQRKRR